MLLLLRKVVLVKPRHSAEVMFPTRFKEAGSPVGQSRQNQLVNLYMYKLLTEVMLSVLLVGRGAGAFIKAKQAAL